MHLVMSPFIGRGLALAILLAILASVWALIVSPVMASLDDQKATIMRLQAKLLLSRKNESRGQEARLDLEALRSDPTLTSSFVDARNEALATAWLQGALKQIVEAHGASMTSVQSLSPETDQAFRAVGIRAVMILDIERLLAIVHAVENHNPLMVVGDVAIRAQGSRNRRQTVGEDTSLTVRLDVHAFVKGSGQ